MSSVRQTSSHPRPELSPPASPSNSSRSQIDAAYKQLKSRDLPATPPTSVSPSHHSDDFSQISSHAPPLSPHQPASSSVGTMSAADLEPLDHSTPLGSQSPPRRSSKHRLADSEHNQSEPNKRRRTDHDRNDTSEEDDLGLDGQTLFSGPLYTLSSQIVTRSQPHPSQNLFSLYDLGPLARTVARKDPVTGEKINKLRKSYEGKIKDFPGKNKAVDKEGEFFDILSYPDTEWDVHYLHGKEIASVLSADGLGLSDDFLLKLDSALEMSTGPLPPAERDKWRSVIDLDSTTSKTQAVGNQAAGQTPDLQERNGRPPLEEAQRPKRRGTKRNYNDDAFEGYAEGYADDYPDDATGDPGDIDDDKRSSVSGSGSSKRRRKVGHLIPSSKTKLSNGPIRPRKR